MKMAGLFNRVTFSCMSTLKNWANFPQASMVFTAVRTYWLSYMSIRKVVESVMTPRHFGSSRATSKASYTWMGSSMLKPPSFLNLFLNGSRLPASQFR
jgi:hypothetical protein